MTFWWRRCVALLSLHVHYSLQEGKSHAITAGDYFFMTQLLFSRISSRTAVYSTSSHHQHLHCLDTYSLNVGNNPYRKGLPHGDSWSNKITRIDLIICSPCWLWSIVDKGNLLVNTVPLPHCPTIPRSLSPRLDKEHWRYSIVQRELMGVETRLKW